MDVVSDEWILYISFSSFIFIPFLPSFLVLFIIHSFQSISFSINFPPLPHLLLSPSLFPLFHYLCTFSPFLPSFHLLYITYFFLCYLFFPPFVPPSVSPSPPHRPVLTCVGVNRVGRPGVPVLHAVLVAVGVVKHQRRGDQQLLGQLGAKLVGQARHDVAHGVFPPP